MTPVRQRMIEAMQPRGLAARTQESYLGAVQQLVNVYSRHKESGVVCRSLMSFMTWCQGPGTIR